MPANNRNFKLLVLASLLSALVLFSACGKPSDAVAVTAAETPAVAKDSATPSADARPVILAFGDSLTEGYGLEKSASYPALLQKRLDEKGYSYRVVNAGISGDTTAGGVNRLDTALKNHNVALMVLELGANDMLRGKDLRETRQNLATMIEKAQAQKIAVVLAGMEAPTNFGEDYQRDFHNIFPDLAKQYKVTLIPFFLADVAGKTELNQGDGIHPNMKGTPLVLENVWRALEPLLKK
ncbi:MAG: arylesterase [Acidobacteria bacterium]|nr:arylesterase [Acidobacteriota bacterium]